MAIEITMPRLSDSMEEGTVARWLVEAGTAVKRGQPIVEIDTDKATMEYEAESDGTLLEIIVPEGETAPIGAPIAWLGAPGETAETLQQIVTSAVSAPAAPAEPPPAAPAAAQPSLQQTVTKSGRANASPVAKRMARELGVDLAAVQATGPNGMITREDVERAAADGDGASAAPADEGLQPLSRIQQAIAKHMIQAASVPVFALEVEVDMAACAELRASLEPKPSFNDLVVKACALALREHPRVNASYTDAGFRPHDRVNVGIAVAAEDALLVPVIHDTDRKTLAEIVQATRELAAKARDGKLTPAELDGGTFTVSNLGMFGIRRFEALLNTPQAAILAVGTVESRPGIVEDGTVAARTLMSATLVSDHRILYGADSARFLTRVKELLESPDALAS
jgi:pyruvate dehydrogenase E2 component (dihydrolipoamide acetyltransferase)